MASKLFANVLLILQGKQNWHYPFTGFTLIDASRQVPLGPLKDGDSLDLGLMGSALNLVAEINQTAQSTVHSVKFDMWTGPTPQNLVSVQDDQAPFTLGASADEGELLFSSVPFLSTVGSSKHLAATAYDALGRALGSFEVTFTTISSSTTSTSLSSAAAAPQAEAAALFKLLLNAGGNNYTDSKNQVWVADSTTAYYNSPGQVKARTRVAIANTVDDYLYQTERYPVPTVNPNLIYTIPVPLGNYQITVHLAEVVYRTIGSRIFDVWIQNKLVRSNLDLVAEVGYANPFLITVSATKVSSISIKLLPVVENPKISAIEIRQVVPPATPSPSRSPSAAPSAGERDPVYFINAGGTNFTDSQGVKWIGDDVFRFYNTGLTSYKNRKTITGVPAADYYLYQTERYDDATTAPNLQYEIPVPNGEYIVVLHFAEVAFTSPNQRVFDVWVEKKVLRANLDIVAEVGPNTPLLLTSTNNIVDSGITIDFVPKVENPKISLIAIYRRPTGRLATPPPAPSAWKTLVNCGGVGLTDSLGRQWVADAYFNSGKTKAKYRQPISNVPAADAPIYQTERYDDPADALTLEYTIPVPSPGKYQVQLMFAELWYTTAGKRVFDIWIENRLAETGLDIVQRVGPYAPLLLTYRYNIKDTSITIKFVSQVENPKISGIYLLQISAAAPVATPRPVATPVRIPTASPTVTGKVGDLLRKNINCGGNNFTDVSGRVWEADALNHYYNTGIVKSKTRLAIKNTDDDYLYQTERYDDTSVLPDLTYTIPLPAGKYTVFLHFAELFYSAAQKRVFNVWVEDKLFYANLDIAAMVGLGAPLILNTTLRVDDGSLRIGFTPVVENPKISAIAIVGLPDGKTGTNPTLAPTVDPFVPIRINAGGALFNDTLGNIWEADSLRKYYVGGSPIYDKGGNVRGTDDDNLYRYQRYGQGGTLFSYNIPLPSGTFRITFYFVEMFYDSVGSRIFAIYIEGQNAFGNVDIIALGAGQFFALKLDIVVPVTDGTLNIEFRPLVGDPKVSAIQVLRNGPHLAHSVPGGPYTGVDIQGVGTAIVPVDGSQSHTHAQGRFLTSWVWTKGTTVLGTGAKANLTLPVGATDIVLTVTDSAGNTASEGTTATVFSKGYPYLTKITPTTGDTAGGAIVTISGYGFNFTADRTIVQFGQVNLTGATRITIVNVNTIRVLSTPPFVLGIPVPISVITPIGKSNAVQFTYVAGVPIQFNGTNILSTYGPATLAFGPDGKLYVGTVAGLLYKITFDDNFNVANVISSSVVANAQPGVTRSILGLTFDPMDTSSTPAVYVSNSQLFHGSCESFTGAGINGKVSKVTGSTLSTLTDIVTGLPVSDHDHGVNGLEFADNGDLYIQIGGNTNAGVPGTLSDCGVQPDNVLSAATLVAHLSTPGFNGTLTYDANGFLSPGKGVEIFASGLRNPFDLVLHSNGYLYGTDNGPNLLAGARSTSCSSSAPDPNQADKLVRLEKGRYYGHANRKRGEQDPRQCVWRWATEPSDGFYTSPLTMLSSSSNGIIEFQSEHFGGQLRHNLIIGKFQGPLYRVILNANGTGVLYNAVAMVTDGGLDVTQGPDGSLFVAQNEEGLVKYYRPIEPASTVLKVQSVFPRRGPLSGGFVLSIHGEKLVVVNGGAPTVTVGGQACPVKSFTATKITCTLPAGTGTVDVVVTGGGGSSSTMKAAFRYIKGKP